MTWRRGHAEVCVLQPPATSSTPSLFSRGKLIAQPNFFVGSWAWTKPPLCWEGGGESNVNWIADARIFLPLFLLQKAVRTALAPLREQADSLNKASHKTDLAFQGQTKRKIAGTLLKQWEVFFVALQAKWRLTRDYHFNSFFISLAKTLVLFHRLSQKLQVVAQLSCGYMNIFRLVSNGNRAFTTTVPLHTCIPPSLLNPEAIFN